MKVGSFKSASAKTPIFDVGGNVAEWVLDEEGRGKVLGGSLAAIVRKRAIGFEPTTSSLGS
jgi:formylglycine-generating enzyme required for sulfatase activity